HEIRDTLLPLPLPRQGEAEARAVARFAFGADPAAVGFHDHLADQQTEAGALFIRQFGAARLFVFLEELADLVPRDAGAAVLDPDFRLVGSAQRADFDRAARRRKFERVAQQVDEHLLDPVRVGIDGAGGAEILAQGDILFGGEKLVAVHDRAQKLVEGQRFGRHFDPAGFELDRSRKLVTSATSLWPLVTIRPSHFFCSSPSGPNRPSLIMSPMAITLTSGERRS